MKIFIKSDNQPLKANAAQGLILTQPDSRTYIGLCQGENKWMPKRHPGELIMRNGWIYLDYDNDGFLVGLEVVEGDPATGVSESIPYLQPRNPLI
jgi:hypothetical protein